MVKSKNIIDGIFKLPKSDHRRIGARQRLFFFDKHSPGSCFFEPRGARIYNKLIEYLRSHYKKSGYHEVITPNIYRSALWEKSGHWDHYKDHMMQVQAGDREFSLKPMNCPGHCLMFKNQPLRSVDEMPVRWADFGVLHRNELSGTLQGLTRVRRFQQDDAHIFCTHSQVESEVKACLDLAKKVYQDFNFTFRLKLSLRPAQYIGDSITWDQAEDSLRKALGNSGRSWDEQEEEGAFYGPKIDLIVRDALDRDHQCATIQLDFQLPERFELSYKAYDAIEQKTIYPRPVMIHRAIVGSVERFIAMIAENSNGRWPFWLSPLQAQIIPVHENYNNYAKKVRDQLRSLGYWVDCDLRSGSSFGAKIRDASMTPYNIVLIVGSNEAAKESVTARLIIKPDGQEGDHDDDDGTRQPSEPDLDKDVQSTDKGSSVRNITLSVQELIDCFGSFEAGLVNRADLKLLENYL